MPNKKVPKLVVKRATTSRKLKPAEEAAAEEREGRSRRITRATGVVARKAKRSLHNNVALLMVAVCAAVVAYGIVATVTATKGEMLEEETGSGIAAATETSEPGGPAASGRHTTGTMAATTSGKSGSAEQARLGRRIKCQKVRDTKDPSIITVITEYEHGIVTQRYREVKIENCPMVMLVPLKPGEEDKKPAKVKRPRDTRRENVDFVPE